MDYEFTEKPKNKPLGSPYRNMFYMVVGICIVSIWAGSSMLKTFAPSDEHMSSPEFIATETAELLETYPELADWERYSDREIAIWLPDTYEAENIEQTLDLVNEGMDFLPPEDVQLVEVLTANPDYVRFIAYDYGSQSFLSIDNVLVGREPARGMSVQRYVDISLENLPSSADVIQDPIEVEFKNYKATYIAYNLHYPPLPKTTAIAYLVNANGYFYVINFTTTADQFESFLPITKTAMDSLRLYNHIPE